MQTLNRNISEHENTLELLRKENNNYIDVQKNTNEEIEKYKSEVELKNVSLNTLLLDIDKLKSELACKESELLKSKDLIENVQVEKDIQESKFTDQVSFSTI